MRINTNTAAMNTYTNLSAANTSKSSSLAKLSSGLRINKAGDDAAGLAISEKMKNQISGMTQASRNAQDGISLIQTAEGALTETHSMLNRMRDLTVQAANDTNTEDDKKAIQGEIESLTDEIDRISENTEFNKQGLMNATEDITTSSLVESGATNSLLQTAYNDVTEETATNRSDTQLAEALSTLSNEDLDTVVAKYNVAKALAVRGDNTPTPVDTIEADEIDITTTAGKTALVTAEFDAEEKVAFATAYNKVMKNTDSTTKKTFAEIGSMSNADYANVKVQYDKNEAARVDSETVAQNKAVADSQIKALDLKQTSSKEFTFQIGANAGEKISVKIENMSAKGLGISDIDVVNGNHDAILEDLDDAISDVSTQRANLGAVQNRLDHTVSNLATTKENLSEANSRITDVDMAEEMMSFTKSNILAQASTSMLAQANQMPQSVLSLLQ